MAASHPCSLAVSRVPKNYDQKCSVVCPWTCRSIKLACAASTILVMGVLHAEGSVRRGKSSDSYCEKAKL